MVDGGKPAVKVRLYRFRNALKEKTAGAGGGSGPAVIDQTALHAATTALEKMAEDYPDWVTKNIEELRAHHAACTSTPGDRARRFASMREVAHDMKGQGGTFGYPLITTFAASLYDCVGLRSGTTDDHVQILKSHIDAMAAVIKDRVKGDGGEIGQALTQGLKAAIARYSKPR